VGGRIRFEITVWVGYGLMIDGPTLMSPRNLESIGTTSGSGRNTNNANIYKDLGVDLVNRMRFERVVTEKQTTNRQLDADQFSLQALFRSGINRISVRSPKLWPKQETTDDGEDEMAVDAVLSEPLSAIQFPLTGKNTGNFSSLASSGFQVKCRYPSACLTFTAP
jgi:hypothetical protein